MEIEAFCKARFSPLEAITSATLISAKTTGIEKTHGTIEVGKKANMVILNANPAEDISNLREVNFVMKNGRTYLRDIYISTKVVM
jgi:imidazolonepropionase-like amidohydrolase